MLKVAEIIKRIKALIRASAMCGATISSALQLKDLLQYRTLRILSPLEAAYFIGVNADLS